MKHFMPPRDRTSIKNVNFYCQPRAGEVHYIHIYTCALAKPGFCSGGNRKNALLSTSTHKNDDSKRLIIVHCLVPVLIATMITIVLVPVWID